MYNENDEFSDTEKTCIDCGDTFVFTAGEAKFFSERGYTAPKRCKPCVVKKKAKMNA